MHAYRLHRGQGIKGLECVEIPELPLQPHEVRIGMHAVSLNYRDLEIARGGTEGSPAITPCSDGAGAVLEVGAAVSQWRAGDRVMGSFFPNWIDGAVTPDKTAGSLGARGPGMLAENVVLPAHALVAVPASLSFAEASTLSCAGVVAWNALFVAGALKPGSTVLLLGTGGVSIWALQLAKAAGLRVLITSSENHKLDIARRLGADDTINYRAQPQWAARVRELTGGRGVDLVLETSGRDTLGQSMAALRPEGTLAVVGGTSGWGGALDVDALIDGALRLRGILVGSRTMAEELVRFVERSGIRPLIDRRFGFDQAAAAYEYLAAARHVGKVVIDIAPEA